MEDPPISTRRSNFRLMFGDDAAVIEECKSKPARVVPSLEPVTLCISFAKGETQTVDVTVLAPNVCRLECTPVTDEEPPLYLGDTIEIEASTDGSHRHRFIRVIERAQLRHHERLVSQQFVESTQYPKFCAVVEAAGGQWETLMGGLFFVHIPIASLFDEATELDRSITAAEG
jgi:hypothetical protein